ncbi:ETC complex I subunit conserved region-domain-containing protein [Lipomyces japonicus]|uniref:ETC complex I subunit conserved region-domain-containing protein n=1 Tax=Lipomyces japonicus TaxID=56871 RepID=UPI0034CF019B
MANRYTVIALSRAVPSCTLGRVAITQSSARAFIRCNSSIPSRPAESETVEPVSAAEAPLKRFDIISGAPEELSTKRIVRIYQRAKTAMQSGTHETKPWRLDWDIDQKSNRWENDLIGWQSSGDYMQATEVKFKSKDDAVRFATNQGWDFYVQEPHKRDFRVKQYASNFLHSKGPLKHIRTK